MEEPNVFLRWTIFLFAGGDGGFWGSFVIAAIAIIGLYPQRKKPFPPNNGGMAFSICLACITCSSPPVPSWFQWMTLIWIALVLSELRSITLRATVVNSHPNVANGKSKRLLLFLSPFAWLLLAIVLELPFHFWIYSEQTISTLLVVGDSVTAGLNDDDDTWPRKLSRLAAIDVLDASQPGATLRSARQQMSLLPDNTGLVMLEIGGNDLLEGLPVKQFDYDLEQLLREVVRSGRSIVMFELPLPPLCAAYGASQRRLATRHRVKLIPKRLFVSVLTTRGSTVDGIHLSDQGQAQMTAMIQSLFSHQLKSGTGRYQRYERR